MIDLNLIKLAEDTLNKFAFVDPNQLAMAEATGGAGSAQQAPSTAAGSPNMGAAATMPPAPPPMPAAPPAQAPPPMPAEPAPQVAPPQPQPGYVSISADSFADIVAAARSGKSRPHEALERLEAENKQFKQMLGLPVEPEATRGGQEQPGAAGAPGSPETNVAGPLGNITNNPNGPQAPVTMGAPAITAPRQKVSSILSHEALLEVLKTL